MIKENKKNKIITFLCACLIVCASAFGLVQAVGTTLASSPTAPTITIETFNYKNANFLDSFDAYITGYKSGTTTTLAYTCQHINTMPSAYNASGFSIVGVYYISSGSTVANNNSFIDAIYTTNGMFGGAPSITFTFANSTNLFSGIGDIEDSIFVILYNSTYYTICPSTLYYKHISYMEGLADADTSSAYNNGYNAGLQDGYTDGYGEGELEGYENGYQEGQDFGYNQGVNAVLNNPNYYGLYTQAQYEQNYTDGYNAGLTAGYNSGYADGQQASDAYQNGYNTGYTDGSNDVLNNPNNYGLYTQAQYEQNYTDGYNAGVLNSQYGILSNVVISGLVEVGDTIEGINNSDFDFNAGTITPNSSLLDLFNSIYSSSYDEPAMAQIRFTLSQQYVYSRENVINFVNTSLLDNSTSYLNITFETTSNQTIPLMYSYNAILVDGVFAGYNIGVIGDDSALFGNTIKSFIINYWFGAYSDGIILTRENLVKPQALSIFSTSVLFDNGYNLGYIDGTRSDVVNGAYDRGVIDGFNSGYSQGLANQDNATFASMISAVIDVPINAMRNLFNFDLLGINLFGFFTALFTLLVVITIVRLILGGK